MMHLRRTYWLIGLLLFILPVPHLLAEDLQAIVQHGNEQYRQGAFEEAVRLYQSVIDSGYESSELYYNLGNAYYKSHDVTLALVNYERARILDPRDEEILQNLEVAREFVVDRIEVLPAFFLQTAWTGFVKILDADTWAVLSVVSFVLALLMFLLYFLVRRQFFRKLGFWVGLALLVLSVSTVVFAAEQHRLTNHHQQAIVLTPSVTIKSAPDETSGTDLFLLHEGTLVTIEDALGEWREVVLSDGNRGWLKVSDLIRL